MEWPSDMELVIDREIVDSSSLASAGYDAEAQILEVEFHHGGVYRYYDVPASAHQGLLAASSVGRFFQSRVRGQYSYRKISA